MNPRIADIANQVEEIVSRGIILPWHAIERVATDLDLSPSIVSDCYHYGDTGMDNPNYYLLSLFSEDEPEDVNPPILPLYVDPYDTAVDDWSEDYWR